VWLAPALQQQWRRAYQGQQQQQRGRNCRRSRRLPLRPLAAARVH
jgi:hypothetical protein